jgi:hypothetical protein
MPSRKPRRGTEEEPESIWSILTESIAEGIVRTVLSEGNKLAEEFLARQQNAMGKKANNANAPEGQMSQNANPPVGEPEPVVDNATTEKSDDNDDIIEGEFKYVD